MPTTARGDPVPRSRGFPPGTYARDGAMEGNGEPGACRAHRGRQAAVRRGRGGSAASDADSAPRSRARAQPHTPERPRQPATGPRPRPIPWLLALPVAACLPVVGHPHVATSRAYLWLAASARAVASRPVARRSRLATPSSKGCRARLGPAAGRLVSGRTRTGTGRDGPPVRDRAAAGLRILPVTAAVSAGCPIGGIPDPTWRPAVRDVLSPALHLSTFFFPWKRSDGACLLACARIKLGRFTSAGPFGGVAA
jgi:hypothetical protein